MFLDLCVGHVDVLSWVKTQGAVHLGLGDLLHVCFTSIRGLLNLKQNKSLVFRLGPDELMAATGAHIQDVVNSA